MLKRRNKFTALVNALALPARASVFGIIRSDLRNGCFSGLAKLSIQTELTYLLSRRVFLIFLCGTRSVQMAKDSTVPGKGPRCHTVTWSRTTRSCFRGRHRLTSNHLNLEEKWSQLSIWKELRSRTAQKKSERKKYIQWGQ